MTIISADTIITEKVIEHFENKMPRWRHRLRATMLRFNGRPLSDYFDFVSSPDGLIKYPLYGEHTVKEISDALGVPYEFGQIAKERLLARKKLIEKKINNMGAQQ